MFYASVRNMTHAIDIVVVQTSLEVAGQINVNQTFNKFIFQHFDLFLCIARLQIINSFFITGFCMVSF